MSKQSIDAPDGLASQRLRSLLSRAGPVFRSSGSRPRSLSARACRRSRPVLLVAYPAWDAIANLADAWRSGGLKANPSQALNVAISLATALAVLFAVGQSPHAVLAVFGIWAILAGPFPACDRRAAVAGRRAMGDGAERRPVGACGRLLHQAGHRRRDTRHHGRRALCGVRRVLLSRLRRMADSDAGPPKQRPRGSRLITNGRLLRGTARGHPPADVPSRAEAQTTIATFADTVSLPSSSVTFEYFACGGFSS